MNASGYDDWLKGGLRYGKLKAIIPEYVAPERVNAFFVATGHSRRRLSRLVNPVSLFQREHVVAATPRRVFVFKLKLPGVFRASVDEVLLKKDREQISVRMKGGVVEIDGIGYRPISFHDEDAEALVALIR